MRKIRPELVLAALAMLSAPAHATDTVTVKDGWFRSLPAKLPAGGYFTLHNGGAATIKLTGAQSPACGMIMLHKTEEKNGTGMMMEVPSIDVPPGGDLTFAPGNYHLMCMDPTPAMKPGAMVKVTLEFADGTQAVSDFAVKNAAGK
ncbi:MAG TPA: copper chaperone PCu(A)C [Rhizomicrobium sp.]|nr:copper chaperone PCu(A)C [Rhizomicrobium sp.]